MFDYGNKLNLTVLIVTNQILLISIYLGLTEPTNSCLKFKETTSYSVTVLLIKIIECNLFSLSNSGVLYVILL